MCALYRAHTLAHYLEFMHFKNPVSTYRKRLIMADKERKEDSEGKQEQHEKGKQDRWYEGEGVGEGEGEARVDRGKPRDPDRPTWITEIENLLKNAETLEMAGFPITALQVRYNALVKALGAYNPLIDTMFKGYAIDTERGRQ